MKVQHFASALAAALVVLSGSSLVFSAAAVPGAALQEARTSNRIRQGVGEDIILNRHVSVSEPTLVASVASDTVVTDSQELYPGQALREARAFSRIRRGVGEDIR